MNNIPGETGNTRLRVFTSITLETCIMHTRQDQNETRLRKRTKALPPQYLGVVTKNGIIRKVIQYK